MDIRKQQLKSYGVEVALVGDHVEFDLGHSLGIEITYEIAEVIPDLTHVDGMKYRVPASEFNIGVITALASVHRQWD